MTRFRPQSESELVEIVRHAAAQEEPLELIGGGTKRALGRPMQAPHTLELGAFSGVTLYEPSDLVLTAGAATPLVEIEATLAAANQMLAFEPGEWGGLFGTAPSASTLGGVLACNISGPRRIRQGAARDHFLGLRGVSGRGEVFKAGGRVVKNVTGYDLCKLLAGSYGTLAALTEVTVKVLPRPEAIRTVLIEGLEIGPAVAAMTAALCSSHELGGAAYVPAALVATGKTMTLVRVEGPVPSVEARAAALRAELAKFGGGEIFGDEASLRLWQSLRDASDLAVPRENALWRVSVAPSAAPAFIAALSRTLDLRYFLDWGGGLVWVAIAGSEDGGVTAIRAALAAGHAMLIRAPDALRAAVPVFQPLAPAVAALTRRVKESFDPKRILNRGRMYPEL